MIYNSLVSPWKYSCYLKKKVLVLRVVRNYPVQLLHFNNKELVRDVNWLCRHLYMWKIFLLSLIFLVYKRETDRKGQRDRFKIYTVYIFHHLPLKAVVRRNRRKEMFSGCASLVLSRLPLLGGCSLPLTLLTHICFLFFALFFPSLIIHCLSVFKKKKFPLFQSSKCCTVGEILLRLGRVRDNSWYSNDTLCHILLLSILHQDTW